MKKKIIKICGFVILIYSFAWNLNFFLRLIGNDVDDDEIYYCLGNFFLYLLLFIMHCYDWRMDIYIFIEKESVEALLANFPRAGANITGSNHALPEFDALQQSSPPSTTLDFVPIIQFYLFNFFFLYALEYFFILLWFFSSTRVEWNKIIINDFIICTNVQKNNC